MFRNILRSSSTTTAMMAGAAAALTGQAFVSSQSSQKVAECSDDKTVVSMLQDLTRKVSSIESTLGGLQKQAGPAKPVKHGIDIVLGAQWGDEGKGKLVDMLSQVSLCEENKSEKIMFLATSSRSISLMV
jgi:hypothetical protein